uniref:Glycosyltransferase family 92 protein n=1 Tax=Panagrolaimus superbus TaxID=310955 RepID=A0A914Y4A0_9BILA
MSRMIAFDDWALLLVALETFRFYGGDLMVAYVECALKEVVDLMKLYESEGILKIQHAYKSSDTPNIPYDSDGQTEYANQMTNSHLCLYEFKESAEFIAFTDWDDILIGPRTNFGLNFGKFVDGFRQLSLSHPFAAAFSIPRFSSFIKKAFRPKINSFSIKKTFNQLEYSKKSLDPKMVVRPSMVAGVWIHRLKVAETWRFHQLTVNSTTAVLLHLKNLILDIGIKDSHPTHPLFRNNGSYFVKPNLLQKNMEKMFRKYNFTFDPSKYSHSKLFHQLIYNCYVKMAKSAEDDTIVYCPSHKACVYPKQNISVIKVKSTHKSSKKMANYIWHERDKVIFDENAKGCL